MKDFFILSKLRLTLSVLFTFVISYYLAHHTYSLFYTLGVYCIISAATLSNSLIEKKDDALMLRTKKRTPLLPKRNWKFIVFLLLLIGSIFLFKNIFLLFGSWLGFFSYIFVYTPLKKISPLALYAGTLPGALPPFFGAYPSDYAYYLFVFLVLWQIPHFLALSLLYKRDYIKTSFRMHSTLYSHRRIYNEIFFFSLLLILASEGFVFFYKNIYVFLGVSILNIFYFFQIFRSVKKFFFTTLVYLPLHLLLLIL